MHGRRLGMVVAAGALALAAAPAAQAAPRAQVAGGDTALRLDRGVARALAGAGISVAPIDPANARGRRVLFPITGGRIDPASLRGRIAHDGGLRFSSKGRRVSLEDFTVRVGRRARLTADVGGSQVTILRLDTSRARLRRELLQTRVSRVDAELTGAAARALNAAFHTHVFRRGLELGSVAVHADLAQLAIDDGETALTLAESAAQTFGSVGVSVAPLRPAAAQDDGAIAFPITRGVVDAETLAGRIGHRGGLRLTRGDAGVSLRAFKIEIGAHGAVLTAAVGGQRVSILNLDVSAVTQEVDEDELRVTVGNVGASLTAEAAAALNQALGLGDALAEGFVLGTAEVRAEL